MFITFSDMPKSVMPAVLPGKRDLIRMTDIRRKACQHLLKWKKSTNHSKALLIKGAGRVGKSYLAEAFAKREYRSRIIIDFASPLKGTMSIFRQYGNRYQLDEFFNQLSVLYGTPLYRKQSLVIFDEIQKYTPAGKQ